MEGVHDSGKACTCMRGREMCIEEGTGEEIGGRRHGNTTMDVRSYEAGQDKKRNNNGTTKVWEIAKKVQERRLKWHGHAMRREEDSVYLGRRTM